MGSTENAGGWRMACVTRARTVAAGVRFVEFALSGAPVAPEPGATVDIVAGPRGAIQTFACLPAEPGSLRILVPRGDTAAARFMWALVEGAHVRGRLSGHIEPRPADRRVPAIRGVPAVRLAVDAAPRRGEAGAAGASPAAGAMNTPRGAMISFPPAGRMGKDAGVGHGEGRTGAAKSSTV